MVARQALCYCGRVLWFHFKFAAVTVAWFLTFLIFANFLNCTFLVRILVNVAQVWKAPVLSWRRMGMWRYKSTYTYCHCMQVVKLTITQATLSPCNGHSVPIETVWLSRTVRLGYMKTRNIMPLPGIEPTFICPSAGNLVITWPSHLASSNVVLLGVTYHHQCPLEQNQQRHSYNGSELTETYKYWD
jgi:hypothetical protein